MAEILYAITDKINSGSKDLDLQNLKRGDVLVVVDDGHPWSEKEKAGDFGGNFEARIAIVPGVPKEKFAQLTQPDVVRVAVTKGAPQDVFVRYRAQKLDLDSPTLNQKFQQTLADKSQYDKIELSELDVTAATKAKEAAPITLSVVPDAVAQRVTKLTLGG